MQKSGKAAKFGSFKYSAADLYEKRELFKPLQRLVTILTSLIADILLPSSTFSPRQFEKLSVVLSSNEVGVFTMEIIDPTASSKSQVLDSCEIRMEDLLQAKFENRATLDLFDQVAKVRVNTLIFLINRSEWFRSQHRKRACLICSGLSL
jgi:Ras GTPase-activating-like protein IQGAP2/3